MHGTRAKLLVPVSGTRNLGGELGSCAMALTTMCLVNDGRMLLVSVDWFAQDVRRSLTTTVFASSLHRQHVPLLNANSSRDSVTSSDCCDIVRPCAGLLTHYSDDKFNCNRLFSFITFPSAVSGSCKLLLP